MNYDNGAITPEAQHSFLKKYGHYIGEAMESRFYILNNFSYRVYMVNGKAVQIFKLSTNEAETIIKCNNLKFNK